MLVASSCRLPLSLVLATLAAVALSTTPAAPLLAQDDPFGFGADVADAADDAAEAAPAEDAPAPPADALTEQLRRYAASPVSRNLAIAVRQAARLRRWDEVDRFLDTLAQRQLNQTQLAEVAAVIGRPLLTRMETSGALDEEALTQVDALRSALTARTTDVETIRNLIPQIASPSVDERLAAFRGLLAGGNVAIAELAAASANPQSELDVTRRQIVAVLERMGPEATEALQQLALYGAPPWRPGALETLAMLNREAAMSDLVAALHGVDATDEERQVARRHLLAALPSLPGREETEAYLHEMLRVANRRVTQAAADGNRATVWDVGDERTSVAPVVTSERLATGRAAVDAANRLRRLGDLPPEIYADALMTDLGYRLQTNPSFGSDEDRQGIVEAWGSDSIFAPRIERVLEQALETERLDAAVALLRLIPADASDELVVSHGGEPTTLVKSVMHPAPRVRYEAARAISRLDVDQRYAGSSEVLDRWIEMASLTRRPIAVLVEPRISVGLQVESLLASLGYRVVRVRTVAEAVERVEEGGDLRWLVANTQPADATAIELVDRVRRRPLGSGVPIIFYGDGEAEADVELASARWEAPVVRTDPPASSVTFSSVMEPILASRPIPPLTTAERLIFSMDGINALAEVSAEDVRYHFYDLRSAGVESVVVSSLAGLDEAKLTVLAQLGTPSSQLTLATMAGNASLPTALRQRAAEAFAESLAQFGTRLARGDVESQYRRYNQATDPEVRQTLSMILDAMERQAGVTSKATTEAEAASSD